MASARLPVPAGIGRLLILLVVFVCAACGLVYELELVALSAYLVGDSVTQASVVLSVMVFAMGVGSLLAKRLRCRAAVGFGVIEALLALVGGGSAMALYACFGWWGESRSALVGFSLAIGVLIGAEVPLLMTLIQRVRRQDAGGAVADLFAADYVGALVGGLAFPFLLLPVLGQLTGTLLTGSVNVVAGGALVLWLFGGDLTVRSRWVLVVANAMVLVLLAAGAVLATPFERAVREAVYGAQARVAVRSDVQEVVITGDAKGQGPAWGSAGRAGVGAGARRVRGPRAETGWGQGHVRPLALYLDGRLRVSADSEYRYHEALVHPAMAAGPRGRVLVLGGGDGLATREVLRCRGVRSVTVVEIDPDVVRLARTDPGLSALNRHAFADPRVRVATADAFDWLRERARRGGGGPYDVVISDLPDPGISVSTKLYSQEFYGLVRRALAPGGRLVVHAGPPLLRPRSFGTVVATLRSVGLGTVAYGVPGRRPDFSGGPDRSARAGAEAGDEAEPDGDAGRAGFPSPGGGAYADRPGERYAYWGFVLAGRGAPRLALAPDAPALRSLTPASLRAAGELLARLQTGSPLPSTLVHPRYGE
ncbi:spermidine synthase [Streptomyces sp. NPDC003077]|uniref:spermidine synthase n=1 Tax=Streptomyces sp. NPDC003077 TaxID=3154443 RepID=UPI0033B02DDE